MPGFANPFGKAIRFSVDARETRRKHFEKSDLKAIFESPVYADDERPAGGGGGGEAAYRPCFASPARLTNLAAGSPRSLCRGSPRSRKTPWRPLPGR
ncbi:hypothetical protein NWI01_27990 [Nitrobacter winogradskyi]|uniref:Uncharacterized protein n=1 Tax=Nitrobacter winogradskyi TaxID=913 RepID=A0A4Y3WD11_NITWI|nr:hypothetical protein NWI01_27990 [Nitrobacter winogradskyi]